MDSLGVGHRPFRMVQFKKPPRERSVSETIYSFRVSSGRDTLTGQPLRGRLAVHWLRNWVKLPETPGKKNQDGTVDTWGADAKQILSADDKRVTYLREDGFSVTIERAPTVEEVFRKGKLRKQKTYAVNLIEISPPPLSPVAA